MSFAVGDRVVVNERYRGAGCNHGAIGFYGHVAAIKFFPATAYGPWIQVAFGGHIDGSAVQGYEWHLQHGDQHPFPCYAFELDHAD